MPLKMRLAAGIGVPSPGPVQPLLVAVGLPEPLQLPNSAGGARVSRPVAPGFMRAQEEPVGLVA